MNPAEQISTRRADESVNELLNQQQALQSDTITVILNYLNYRYNTKITIS